MQRLIEGSRPKEKMQVIETINFNGYRFLMQITQST